MEPALDEEAQDAILDAIERLLEEIRPDAVALVDGFGFSDYDLKSTLGHFDENGYEAIYREARMSPLNQTPRMLGWEELGKVLDLDFLREGKEMQRAGAQLAPRAAALGGVPASSSSARHTKPVTSSNL